MYHIEYNPFIVNFKKKNKFIFSPMYLNRFFAVHITQTTEKRRTKILFRIVYKEAECLKSRITIIAS